VNVSRPNIKYNSGFSEKWVFQLSPQEWRGKVDVEFVQVPLSSLEHAGCWTDPEVVSGWVRTLSDSKPIPPPVAVLTERGTYYLHDGNHRLDALRIFVTDTGCEPLVQIALVSPIAGHKFVYRSFGEYGTYVIRDAPTPITIIARFITAIVASTLGLGTTLLIPSADHTPAYGLLVLSVMIAAWAGGWKAGLLAALLNSTGAAYFLLPPNGSLLIARPVQAIDFLVAALVMLAVALFMDFVRKYPSLSLEGFTRIYLGKMKGTRPQS
jgi:hypothetical protein